MSTPPDTGRAITAEDLYRLQFVGDPQLSPDGARVAFVVTVADEGRNDYRSRIWLAETAGDRPPRPLTAGAAKDTAPRWSPDGRRLAFLSDREPAVRPPGAEEGDPAKPQIWTLDLAGGEARQVTALKNGAADPAWSPDGRRIAFTSQTGGDEEEDDRGSSTGAGEPGGGRKARTKEERAKDRANKVREITTLKYKWDGVGFFDGKRRHLFVVDLAAAGAGDALPATRQLTDGDWNDGAPAWSPDGAALAFTSYREPDEDVTFRSDIHVLALAGGAPRKLTGSKGPTAAPRWSPDGRLIAFLGHEEGEGSAATTRLWTVAADGAAPPRCLSRDFDRDLGNSTLTDQTLPAGDAGPAWTAAGDAILALVSDGGTCGLRRFPLDGGDPAPVIGGDRTVTAFSAAAGRIAFAATDPATPAELFAAGADGAAERPLTALNRDLLAARDIARPERLCFRGHNDDPIDGWLLRPPAATGDRPAPLIVQIHGGPHAQYGAAFFHEFQVLAARGYAVFACNPHGSTGRGERFAKELLRAWGERAMPDVMAGVDAALARGGLDPARLGLTGGSYGGYLTNWIITQTGRFRAAVTQRSYCNALGYFGVDDIGAITDVAELGGHPWEVTDRYLRLSPLMHVASVTTPTLIEHQEHDYRCPLSQAEQWHAALKKVGVPTKLLIYPNESHGMSRNGQPRHRVERLHHNVAWFDQWLPDTGRGA